MIPDEPVGLDWWAVTMALVLMVSLLVLVGLLQSRGLLW